MLTGKETELMKKYGLEFSDFKDDEWRELLDNYVHRSTKIVEHYIPEYKRSKFYIDLIDFQVLRTKVYEQFEILCKTAGIDDESENYHTISEVLMMT